MDRPAGLELTMSSFSIGRKGLLLLCCLFAARLAVAEPFIVGVATHSMNNLAQPLRSLELARAAGITSVRDDAFWSTAEPAPGQLRVIPQWRAWLSTANSLDLTPMVILGYGTSFNGNAKPRTPAVKIPYLNYVDYISRQLGNPVKYFEVWNEWDIEGPKDPRLSSDYVALVRDAAPIIRKNNPQAKILAGAVTSAGIKGGFVDRMLAAGVLKYADGISLHPYVHCEGRDRNTPESWIGWMRSVDNSISSKAGRPVPLYLTEMSWPSHEGNCGITPVRQSAWLARAYFLARTVPNIKGMWWYDLINDGKVRDDQEHHFGLLNVDLSAKPAYSTLKAISPYLRDFTYDASHSLQADNLYKLAFSDGRERILVAWATGRPREDRISASAMNNAALRVLDTQTPDKGMQNSNQHWSCSGDVCSAPVTLTEFPKIFRLSPGA
jgi:polysaccharide biosynthesis protein PslG